MGKRYFLLFSSIILLLFSVISCRNEALPGEKLLGKQFSGMSSKDLHSDKADFKVVTLTFDKEHMAKLNNKNYYYYDCPLTEKNFQEIRSLLYSTIKIYLNDLDPEGQEANENIRNLFKELQHSDLFVLSSTALDEILVDFETEEFNFKGYAGLGSFDGQDYLIWLISTQNLKKGYIFG